MEERMHVYASVDEADIGLIRRAKEREQPVHFTVDAYPDDLFEGVIYQIRTSSTITQNVVTYPVIVEAGNPELKLLPGMTANISFQVHAKDNVVKIPNAALRFYPARKHVRKEDRKILDGVENTSDDENDSTDGDTPAGRTGDTGRHPANYRDGKDHDWNHSPI